MISRAGLWMLLVVCSAAYETYDQSQRIDMNGDMFSEDEYQDPGQYELETREDPVQDLMMYKLLNMLRNKDDVQLRMHYRPKFSMAEKPLTPAAYMPATELLDFKDATAKRVSDANGSVSTVVSKMKPSIHKQPKWKAKKGRNPKVGSQMVCYFKLCAFRPPI